MSSSVRIVSAVDTPKLISSLEFKEKGTKYSVSSGKFILYKDPLKNYNHIDMSLLPIADIFYNPIWENLDEKEYFIKPEDIHKLRVISNSTEQFSVREANIILHKQMTMMKDVGRF